MMVLLQKGGGGIGIVEVVFKVFTVVLNLRLNNGVEFYDSLHVFREEHGTGTATLEAKLSQQLARLAHHLLF